MKLEELNVNEGNAEYQKWVSAVKKISSKYQIIGSLKKARAICYDRKDSPAIGIWNGTSGEVFPLEEASELNERHVGKIDNFQPPVSKPTGYGFHNATELNGGSNPIEFDGKEWLLTGKIGKIGLVKVFEYSCKDDGLDDRIWVDVHGNVTRG